jgi:hypothetical protein
MNMFEIPSPYYNPVKAIIQKTYDEHALGTAPWGAEATVAGVACFYTRDCAIGMNIKSDEIKALMDSEKHPDIRNILEDGDNSWLAQAVRLELFGTKQRPPDVVLTVLRYVQSSHDKAARIDNRAYYRGRLDVLCDLYGVLITGRV